MPLQPAALAETRATATRLVQLLPATAARRTSANGAKADSPSIPEWLPVTLLYCAMAVGIALNALDMSRASPVTSPDRSPAATLPAAAPDSRTDDRSRTHP